MKENEIFVNNLNAFIHEMLIAAQSLTPKPSEYLVFNTPNESNYQWYILIFFPDVTQHNQAIKNGVCYQIHKYVWDNLSLSNDFKGLNKIILFESGTVPKTENEIDQIISDTIKRSESFIKEQGQTNPETCSICNHQMGGHQAMGIPDEVSGIPSGGWMTCSEENCNCFRTWDLQVINESPQNK
jgi:hypothetical protein